MTGCLYFEVGSKAADDRHQQGLVIHFVVLEYDWIRIACRTKIRAPKPLRKCTCTGKDCGSNVKSDHSS